MIPIAITPTRSGKINKIRKKDDVSAWGFIGTVLFFLAIGALIGWFIIQELVFQYGCEVIFP